MKKVSLFLALLLLLPTGGTAASADGTTQKVVVTAGRIEEKAASVTQAVTVISSGEIRKNQHQDIGGLLRQHGLYVGSSAANSSFSQISVRGMRTNLFGDELQSPVLILVDGRRTGTSNISLLPMVNVERIEIMRGAGAVQYGASAMGGVVNIITRRGSEETTAMAEFGAGSFETFRTQGEVAGYLNGFDYSLGASFLTSDDYKTGSGWLYENSAADRKIGYNVNLGYNFLEEHRVGLTALGVDAAGMGSPNDVRAHDLTAHNDRYNYSFDFSYEGGASDYGLDWKTRYFVGRNSYSNWEPASLWSPFYQNRADYQGAQGQLSFTRSILTLTGGMDWTKHDMWDYSSGDSEYRNTGLFLLGKLSFMEDLLIISGGVRYDDYKIEMGRHDDSLDNTAPSVGLALNPLSWLTLRANYGESFVIPSAMQFLGFAPYSYIGNPDLDPETGKGWDAGFDLHYRSLNFGVTYFQTDYDDKIAYRPVGGGNSQYYNIDGTVKYRGIEVQAGLDIGEFMDWTFALRPYINFTRMLKYDDQNGHKLPNVSKMDLAYGLGFNHPEWGLDVDLRFIYFGEQKITDIHPVTWAASEDTIGGRTTADLYITKSFYRSEKLGTFSVKAELRNIFDKDYYLTKDYPMPGRSYWLGLRYDY